MQFSCYPKPMFQTEAKCKLIDMKMIFIFSCKCRSLSQKRVWTWLRTESKGFWNSEMANQCDNDKESFSSHTL